MKNSSFLKDEGIAFSSSRWMLYVQNEYGLIVMGMNMQWCMTGMNMQWCYPLRKLWMYSLLTYLLVLSGLFCINFTYFFSTSKIKDDL